MFKDRVVVVRMYECMKMYEDLFPYHRIIFFFRVRFFYHTSSYIPTFVFVIRIYFFLYEECMKNSSYSLFVSLFVRKNRLFPSFFSCKKKNNNICQEAISFRNRSIVSFNISVVSSFTSSDSIPDMKILL